jgi:hypothetical protein|tara:strand:- start:247 stop:534 length:288 start_codon:yes stop_codon:yes gene_type:complete
VGKIAKPRIDAPGSLAKVGFFQSMTATASTALKPISFAELAIEAAPECLDLLTSSEAPSDEETIHVAIKRLRVPLASQERPSRPQESLSTPQHPS